jgi:DNA-binding Lrp family transcriptional regulator
MVALALADRVNQDWEAWPSLEDIARRTGLSPRQVRTHLRQLETEGVIENRGQRVINAQATSNLWIWLWRLEAWAEVHFPPGRKSTSPPL